VGSFTEEPDSLGFLVISVKIYSYMKRKITICNLDGGIDLGLFSGRFYLHAFNARFIIRKIVFF
jgi:hypothetical protein